ncbi:PKHD-type hydroxylase [Fontimonas thermophila]|uniref:PKHD-type hydroxylase n=1 Tax=Fontimonas thermophila TaxID=1076937 RepID=A0A1I2ICJ0_9GAMM|nr:Fe2+-dependent dioxygenase [Fontimonas thermophila]SFF40069.1 PKHD-type hydroxylase [Fontimonas thermophila]
MLLQIPNILTKDQVAHCRRQLDEAEWVDGNVTSGPQAALAKKNMQLPEQSPVARALGEMILSALGRSPLFFAAALPARIYPPLFNRYRGGESFGNHIDNAVRTVPGSSVRVRTDLSATLFLSEPDEYEGGELIVEDLYGIHRIKLAAGHLVLYPASSVHRVTPVTRGTRLASFFWIQSMVRDDGERTLLFDLDRAVQQLAANAPDHPIVVQLTGVYHNLLRRWVDV